MGDMNSLEQAEDLKAFERRLTEYVSCLQPATGRWRMILIVVSVCTATGAWNWLIDPDTQKVSFFFITVESPLLHHQLHHSHSTLLCWDTQTSCGAINYRCPLSDSFSRIQHVL